MLPTHSSVARLLVLLGVWLAIASALYANTLNVPSQYSTISAAITAANSGDTIQVAAGPTTRISSLANRSR